MKRLFANLPLLWTNWITGLGAVTIAASAATLALALVVGSIVSMQPYLTAAIFLVMPAFLLFGLALVAFGLFLDRRRKLKRGQGPDDPLIAALRQAFEVKAVRRRLTWLAVASLATLLIGGSAGVTVVHFMDTPTFCGEVCHTVMQPEYEAYKRSPHSRVDCVECHIGPGASWAVKAKIDGLRQVIAVARDSYERPIPSPVKALRPARDTCEECHWPSKFHGSRIAVRTRYLDDEKNTPQTNALLMHIGGDDPLTGKFRGIHWHVSPDVEIRYEALDEKREKIGRVTRLDKGKVTAVYEPAKQGEPVLETRSMDCVDCHNRPSHVYDRSVAAAVDRGFSEGLFDPKVPYLHAVAVKLLDRRDVGRDNAEKAFRAAIENTYTKYYKNVKLDDAAFDRAAKGLARLYRDNVFPAMNVGWGTYTTHLGHAGDDNDRRGCFRCHDEEHKTKDGKTISQDCSLCHDILAMDESTANLADALKGLVPAAAAR